MEPPVKPDESDCCNSGCNPCILDVYEDQLKKYQKFLKGDLKKSNNCLSPTSFTIFKLINIAKHSMDCNLYTFEYVKPLKIYQKQSTVCVLYEPGQHFVLKGHFCFETFQKAYTPIFVDNQPENQFTVIVKLYENGRMSRFISNLIIGGETLWRGPYGDYKVNYEEENILFIAQGTGIAPFYTIICHILKNEECYTFLRLFFCCNSKNALLRDELYKLTQFWNFKYDLFISGSGDSFPKKYNENAHFSRLNTENIDVFLKETKGGVKVLVCGAEIFCENIRNMLVQCDVHSDDIVIF